MQKFLAWFASALRHFEDLLAHASSPVLAAGAALGVIDLITGSHLFASHPALLYSWAVTQAVGIEVMLPMMADRIVSSWQQKNYFGALFYVLMTGVLGYIAFLGGMVVSLEQTEGINTTQAMQQMGITPIEWLYMRNGLAIVLVVLSGVLRMKAKVKTVAELEAEMAEGDTRARYAAWKRQQLARNAKGVMALGKALVKGQDVQEDAPEAVQQDEPEAVGGVLALVPPSGGPSVQTRLKRAYTPGMSASALAKLARVHRATAAKYIRAQTEASA